MQMMKKCRGLPCDRHLDRRKVAIAATAVLLLFATSARAGITDMRLNEAASSLTWGGSVDLSPFGGSPNAPLLGQPDQATNTPGAGSTAHYAGQMYVDINAGVYIQPIATGPWYTNATGYAPGVPNYTKGAYIPYTATFPQQSNPNFSPPGPWDYGNYGIQPQNAPAWVRMNDLSIGATPGFGANGPLPHVGGGAYANAPQIWGMLSGIQRLSSAFGNDQTDMLSDPFPFPIGGTLDVRPAQWGTGTPTYAPNNTISTWDGATLTMNVNGTVIYLLGGEDTPEDFSDDVKVTQTFTGQLVMTPFVPEPSTMTLLGLGAIGLLGCVVRARRRRTLAA